MGNKNYKHNSQKHTTPNSSEVGRSKEVLKLYVVSHVWQGMASPNTSNEQQIKIKIKRTKPLKNKILNLNI